MTDADLAQLASHIQYRLSPLGMRGDPRIDDLTALVVRHWPHIYLEEILPHGRTHAMEPHIMRLLDCQVREQWEARHSMDAVWRTAIESTIEVIADLWWATEGWRMRLRAMARRQREAARATGETGR
jgi:hypothetical protein